MTHHDKIVSIEEYVKIQTDNNFNYNKNEKYVEYEGFPYVKQEVYEQYKIDKYKDTNKELIDEDHDIIRKEFHDTIPKILELSTFLEIYS